MYLFPHPLGIYKDVYLRKDRKAVSSASECRQMHAENKLLSVLSSSPETHLGDSQTCSWVIISEFVDKQQDLVSHQQLELSKEQWETQVQKEDAIVKWLVGLFVCVLKLLVERNRDMLQILWFWQSMGDTNCLVGVAYSIFLN